MNEPDTAATLDEVTARAVRAAMLRSERRYVLTILPDDLLAPAVMGRIKVSWPGLPDTATHISSHLDWRSLGVVMVWADESFEALGVGYQPKCLLGCVVVSAPDADTT